MKLQAIGENLLLMFISDFLHVIDFYKELLY